MATEFRMPKLGLTMEEGTIVEWLVADGAEVADGSPVLLIETDKVETEVNVTGSGRLVHAAGTGDTLRCGELVGYVLAPGESVPAAERPTVAAAPAPAAPAAPVAAATPVRTGGRVFASPNARRVAAAAGISLTSLTGTGPGGRIVSEDVEEAIAARVSAPAEPGRSSAPAAGSPATVAARQLADLLGVDLARVAPDPADGRVTREAVARHVRHLLAAPAEQPATRAAPLQTPSAVVPWRGVRKAIAARMHDSLRQTAQLTLHMDADLDAVVAHRRVVGDGAPGYTDYVIAAVARALRQHPTVNAQVVDDGIALLPDIHVGMAVAVDEGLVVPVVRHADRLGLDELSAVTRRLADAARTRRLTLDDLEGGTFSVSALGMFGVDGFTPIINPPNVAILGVGRLRDDVVLVDGTPATATRMTLSLTWDHRVLDGAPAAEFCRTVAALLADPAALTGGGSA